MLKKILKEIKLFRKAFLTDFFKIHYSQFGEDIVLKELLKKEKRDGFYVDVGCYHPKKYSNTYYLYKRGWSGINIDMEEDKIRLFNIVRKNDYNIEAAISDKNEEVSIYRYSQYGLGSTISKEYAETMDDEVFDKKTTMSKTLNEIISNSPYKEKQIDVLSIDVEGMDYKVLSSLDFTIYKPKVIIVEDHHKNIDDILKADTYIFLKNNSYILRSWTFYSLIFILPESDILKDRENPLS